jgi:uncharacterized protein DUF6064
MIPFSREAFLEVFRSYNDATWPAVLVLTALALVTVVAALRDARRASLLAGGTLALLWAWMAIAYHWVQFVRVTPAAWLFGAMFGCEALLLAHAVVRDRLRFGARPGASRTIGLVIIAYALLVYPALAIGTDHAYPRAPSFGLPCPTTIFTFGVLLLTHDRVPRQVLVLPTLWAAVASMAPLKFGIWEDVGLPIAACVTIVVLQLRDRPSTRQARKRSTS